LIVNGPVCEKLRPKLKTLYEQMPEPKWVIAMGECAISGGPYWDSYSVVAGADTFMPVDVYIPGCPVRPEALMHGFLTLQKKIRAKEPGMFLRR
jgi:NADH-quinone oxidoreductase subunit B